MGAHVSPRAQQANTPRWYGGGEDFLEERGSGSRGLGGWKREPQGLKTEWSVDVKERVGNTKYPIIFAVGTTV